MAKNAEEEFISNPLEEELISSPLVEMELMGHRDNVQNDNVQKVSMTTEPRQDETNEGSSTDKTKRTRQPVGRSKSFQDITKSVRNLVSPSGDEKKGFSRKHSLKRNVHSQYGELEFDEDFEENKRRGKKIFNLFGLVKKRSQRGREDNSHDRQLVSDVSGPENVNVYKDGDSARVAVENYRLMAQHLREELNDSRAAVQLLEKAMNIQRQFEQGDSAYYGKLLFDYAVTIANLGREEEAQEIFVEAAQLAYSPHVRASAKH